MKTIKVRRDIIIVSLRLIPDNMSIEDVIKYYNEYGIMFYDSSLDKNAKIPRKLSFTKEIILTDVSTDEGKEFLKTIEKNKTSKDS